MVWSTVSKALLKSKNIPNVKSFWSNEFSTEFVKFSKADSTDLPFINPNCEAVNYIVVNTVLLKPKKHNFFQQFTEEHQ